MLVEEVTHELNYDYYETRNKKRSQKVKRYASNDNVEAVSEILSRPSVQERVWRDPSHRLQAHIAEVNLRKHK